MVYPVLIGYPRLFLVIYTDLSSNVLLYNNTIDKSSLNLNCYFCFKSSNIIIQEKQKKCIKCKKVFKTKYGLKLHLKEHFDER